MEIAADFCAPYSSKRLVIVLDSLINYRDLIRVADNQRIGSDTKRLLSYL